MTKEIPLTQGKVALVDDEDHEWLSRYRWCAKVSGGSTVYAVRTVWIANGTKTVYMHREILGVLPGIDVDHINGNGLDNRRRNLRVCTRAENLRNKGLTKKNTSGYKGVCWHRHNLKWHAQISVNGKTVDLGYFDSKEDAARIYNDAATKHYKAFARLNEIPAL